MHCIIAMASRKHNLQKAMQFQTNSIEVPSTNKQRFDEAMRKRTAHSIEQMYKAKQTNAFEEEMRSRMAQTIKAEQTISDEDIASDCASKDDVDNNNKHESMQHGDEKEDRMDCTAMEAQTNNDAEDQQMDCTLARIKQWMSNNKPTKSTWKYLLSGLTVASACYCANDAFGHQQQPIINNHSGRDLMEECEHEKDIEKKSKCFTDILQNIQQQLNMCQAKLAKTEGDIAADKWQNFRWTVQLGEPYETFFEITLDIGIESRMEIITMAIQQNRLDDWTR
jgi:hypothetical protein